MTSHVVVIDSTARRAVIKTTPGKFLSDILQEACSKLGHDANEYGLKSNNKHVDVSRTIRLSGLSSGAKLELVHLSRSPSVISVALQLPETEAQNAGNLRLTKKFSSNTTLWLILRNFESGEAGDSGTTKNFTARGVTQTNVGESGAGCLFYETPVVQAMGRELSSFTELQKTLGQLGFNSGNILLRLSFKNSGIPLEQAMKQIELYFASTGSEGKNTSQSTGGGDCNPAHENSKPDVVGDVSNENKPQEPLGLSPSPVDPTPTQKTNLKGEYVTADERILDDPSSKQIADGINKRPISIFAPPSNDTPLAASQRYDEADYEPTVDHAKLHQSRFAISARNRRLPTDAELASQQTSQAQKLFEEKEVDIKIRFPDQTQVVSKFSNVDTLADLYTFVRNLMENENEPFSLQVGAAGGSKVLAKGSKQILIREMGMIGRVLVTFSWDESASNNARLGSPVKERWRKRAREIEIPNIGGADMKDDKIMMNEEKGDKQAAAKEKGKAGMPKWLKLPGKK